MANEARYSGLAKQYQKYRWGYPAESVDYIIQETGLTPEDLIADIGSGTGILSGMMLERGLKVTGVEPNDDMRSVAQEALGERYIVSAGAAEDTGLPTHSVSLITVAMAFHWFNAKLFSAECRRILIPGCKVAIFQADYDPSASITKGLAELNRSLSRDKSAMWSFMWAYSEASLKRFFLKESYQTEVFACPVYLDKEEFIGFVQSHSLAPKSEDTAFSQYITGLEALFDKHSARNMRLEIPWITKIFYGEV